MSCTRQPERADTKDAPLDSSLSPTSTTNKTLLFSGRAPTPRCAATRRTVARRHDIDFSSPCTLICLNLTTHSPAYPLQRRARASTDPPPPRAQRQLVGQERTALPVLLHGNVRTGHALNAAPPLWWLAGRRAPQSSPPASKLRPDQISTHSGAQ
ncbi:hypothetical protein BKA80DRAFT_279963 [Phyllosticta citrichinensis]